MDNDKIEILNSLNARYEMLIEQFKIVEQQVLELALFGYELETIQNNKNQEMMVSLGKSVFAPVSFKEDQKLLVDVGAGHFIHKNIDETKSVIKNQKERLESFKIQISSEIENISRELQNL